MINIKQCIYLVLFLVIALTVHFELLVTLGNEIKQNGWALLANFKPKQTIQLHSFNES